MAAPGPLLPYNITLDRVQVRDLPLLHIPLPFEAGKKTWNHRIRQVRSSAGKDLSPIARKLRILERESGCQ
ncbi:unnamed protein product [Sphenostylis stenocarpa]|uniref:Uncharacterized protein n=1 Tax=Sphenostylis stenocarpa TaxID=92480 RepID=A0AA86RME3_9FABA|nr:unnamed protein product [Sphenostylis stenocarpa]